MPDPHAKIRVLHVDDNRDVADALRMKLSREREFEWTGWLERADTMVDAAANARASVVVVDLDMPGPDPVAAIQTLAQSHPQIRVVVFSGHVHADNVERALNAGAWGYASKNDGEDELVEILRSVAIGQVRLSPEARVVYGS